jgi:hypothetical protein
MFSAESTELFFSTDFLAPFPLCGIPCAAMIGSAIQPASKKYFQVAVSEPG